MIPLNLNELAAFATIATERSFTRAAAKLGVSSSALSHAMRSLEDQIGVRLLARTTRSVTPTDAGQRLLHVFAPMLEELEAEVASLADHRDRPAGLVRITADEHAQGTLLWPALIPVLRTYPEIHLELITDYGLTDIVAARYDGGVRLAGAVTKDMVAVPIGPPMRMAVVASPSYLDAHGTPRVPQDLARHRCINLRLPTHGGLYSWEFERRGRQTRMRVEGQLTFNSIGPMLEAALEGFGLAYLSASQVEPWVAKKQLVSVLDEWLPPFDGYHLYYPGRRQPTAAFRVIIEALRFRP